MAGFEPNSSAVVNNHCQLCQNESISKYGKNAKNYFGFLSDPKLCLFYYDPFF